MRKAKSLFLVLATTICLSANTGIPMAAVSCGSMLIMFIPVLFLETFIVSLYVKIKFLKSLRTMFFANLMTMIIGFPLANLLGYFYNIIAYWLLRILNIDLIHTNPTFYKAVIAFSWFDKVDHVKFEASNHQKPFPLEPFWYTAVVLAITFILNYLVSFYIEYRYMRKNLDGNFNTIKAASFLANFASYILLFLFSLYFYNRA